jgi:hypothetical protein
VERRRPATSAPSLNGLRGPHFGRGYPTPPSLSHSLPPLFFLAMRRIVRRLATVGSLIRGAELRLESLHHGAHELHLEAAVSLFLLRWPPRSSSFLASPSSLRNCCSSGHMGAVPNHHHRVTWPRSASTASLSPSIPFHSR